MPTPKTVVLRTIEPRDHKPGWWFLSLLSGTKKLYQQFEFPDSEMEAIITAKAATPLAARLSTNVTGYRVAAEGPNHIVTTSLMMFDRMVKSTRRNRVGGLTGGTHLQACRKAVSKGYPARFRFDNHGTLVGIYFLDAGNHYHIEPPK